MKVLYMSDLHLEFHADDGKAFVDSLPDADVLVLAGDITTLGRRGLPRLALFSRFRDVVYVAGNHEYYHQHPGDAQQRLMDFCANNKNFHWLNRSSVEIGGRRFVGASLWFPPNGAVDRNREWLNDFAVIKNFSRWWKTQNALDVQFLRNNVRSGDIVVTHHLPSERSVSDRFKGSTYNCFFVCPMDDLIQNVQPEFWIHGHTHDSCDYRIDKTRVICNPLGYVPHEVNGNFGIHSLSLTAPSNPATKAPMTTAEFLSKLEKMDACEPARDWVATQPDAQTAWDSCTNLEWMRWYFYETATPKMKEEYLKVQRPTWEEYEKVTQPAWEEYQKVKRAAYEEYLKVERAALEEYEKVQQPAEKEYQKVKRAAYEEYEKVVRPAYEEYLKVERAALEEYEKVQRPTWEEYEKVQRPALEEYEKVVRAAKEEYEKVQRPTWEEYEKVVRTAYEEYQKVEQPAWEEYQKACIAAIRKLMPSP